MPWDDYYFQSHPSRNQIFREILLSIIANGQLSSLIHIKFQLLICSKPRCFCVVHESFNIFHLFWALSSKNVRPILCDQNIILYSNPYPSIPVEKRTMVQLFTFRILKTDLFSTAASQSLVQFIVRLQLSFWQWGSPCKPVSRHWLSWGGGGEMGRKERRSKGVGSLRDVLTHTTYFLLAVLHANRRVWKRL